MSDQPMSEQPEPDRPSAFTPPPPPPPSGHGGAGAPPPPPAGFGTAADELTDEPADERPAPKPRKSSGTSITLTAPLALSVVGTVLVVLGLVLGFALTDGAPKTKLWDTMSWTWGVVGIAAAALTLLPSIGSALNLTAAQIRSLALGAAITLAAWWALFILPNLETTGGFLVTAGAAAAILAVWQSTKATPAVVVDHDA